MEEDLRVLYVGNLDPRATESFISDIFSSIGPVKRCKLITGREHPDEAPYCFVEFDDHKTASKAIAAMNGRTIFDKKIKVNWRASNASTRKDSTDHHQVFIGDLSSDVDSCTLKAAFQPFGVVVDARVVRDHFTGRSKSYGFVSFVNKMDACNAIQQMNGVFLNGRAIRCNWGARKGSEQGPKQLSLEDISAQATAYNSTVYVGGISLCTSEELIRQKFVSHGIITDIRIFADKGYAFVKFVRHEEAACAIWQCNGTELAGSIIKCSWGREDPTILMQLHQYYQQISQYAHQGSHQAVPCIPGTATAAAIPVSSAPSCYQMYYHQTQYPYYNSQCTATQSPYNHGPTPQSMAASSGAASLPIQGLYSRRV